MQESNDLKRSSHDGFRFCLVLFCCLAFWCTGFAGAQTSETKPERTSSVGLPATIDQLVLPAPKVIARKIEDREQAIVVRIIETYPHGDEFRYDLEYYGMEPGKYNLADYLINEDNSAASHLPEINVEITSVLNSEEFPAPNKLEQRPARLFNFYLPLLLVGGAIWFVGLLAILFLGRGRKRTLTRTQHRQSVAERMKPLIQAAMAGELDESGKVELERTLDAFWQKKLRLQHLSADDLRQHLRNHPEAGIMLSHIDRWLYQPGSSDTVDVNKLLEPYQTFDPENEQ